MSSSATERPFQSSLEAALAMIAREQPKLHHALCRELGRTLIDARVDGERIRIEGTGDHIHVVSISPRHAAATPDAISVASDLGTIDDLLDGRASLLDVVWADRVVLRGSLDQLLCAHDALIVFLRAAVRCPTAPELLKKFREEVRRSASAVPAQPTEPAQERGFSAA